MLHHLPLVVLLLLRKCGHHLSYSTADLLCWRLACECGAELVAPAPVWSWSSQTRFDVKGASGHGLFLRLDFIQTHFPAKQALGKVSVINRIPCNNVT